MRLTNKFMALMAAAVMTITPLAAQTQPESSERKGRMHRAQGQRNPERMIERMAVVLELTEAQKQTAKDLFAQARTASEPVAAELKQTRQALADAVKSNNQAQITQLTEKQGNLMGQLAGVRAKAMADFHAQLTPEQKEKAEKLRGQFKGRFGKGAKRG